MAKKTTTNGGAPHKGAATIKQDNAALIKESVELLLKDAKEQGENTKVYLDSFALGNAHDERTLNGIKWFTRIFEGLTQVAKNLADLTTDEQKEAFDHELVEAFTEFRQKCLIMNNEAIRCLADLKVDALACYACFGDYRVAKCKNYDKVEAHYLKLFKAQTELFDLFYEKFMDGKY